MPGLQWQQIQIRVLLLSTVWFLTIPVKSLDNKIDQDGNDFDITLDTVFVKNFATALGTNSTLGEKQFTLNLSECDNATVKDASAQFNSGGSSSTSGGLLVPPANLQGAAENVNWCWLTTVTALPI